jgi:hypothetical protein
MSRTPRFQIGVPATPPTDLVELGRCIDTLPEPDRQALRPIYERVAESFRLRTRIMNVAKEALETIRLELSVLRFDLEATRREKETLKKQIDEGMK